jgi:hypothetical protein
MISDIIFNQIILTIIDNRNLLELTAIFDKITTFV